MVFRVSLNLRIVFAICFIGLILGGCSTITTLSNEPLPSQIALKTTKECKKTSKKSLYPGGKEWNECTRDAARLSFEYAQMATNVYSESNSTPFNLGLKLKPLEPLYSNNETGLQYRVYERHENGERLEVIISYRGTDFNSWQDWVFGNIGLKQRSEALAVFDRVSRDYGFKPSVTGHSLGGALAMQVSLCRDVHFNIVFDASPRFSKRFCGASYENHNVSIVEFGEVNKVLRVLGREATQRYVSLNCIDKGNAISQHSMEKLAVCLTNIAALDDPNANSSQLRNSMPLNPNEWE